ncbi:hypothetical protein GDO81_018422 [Engystomops pustulosus]|uniref:Selenocysteine-specific elongation factor n=1 Tax=Engystomops pustulosus TaxID=76066 RepID=A0AAV7A9B9_ENGPU|nr:hypothetical protein GDO81_018422 [Engystomops pustulosus]
MAPVGETLNFNVGVLGHIDSGKTSLAKALSTTASTAAFDKNPQSRERGITLDLGFSSFTVPLPEHLSRTGYRKLQFTLVDCPGHASLIRTIIGVIQTKSLCSPQHMELMLLLFFPLPNQLQLWVETCPPLLMLLKSQAYLPRRDPSGPFLMAVDHCFSIRGQGTVMTGTILSGSVSLNDNVEIPALKVTKKVKSMQMFHQPVSSAMQGDRLGICVTQFDPKLLERGLVCTPDSLTTIHAAIVSVKKIPYFKGSLHTKAKFHITLGHETVMGRVMFFSLPPPHLSDSESAEHFDYGKEYLYQDSYVTKDSDKGEGPQGEELIPGQQWALLEFEKPVTCPKLCLVIGSKLDTDIHSNTCRLAFHGVLLEGAEDKNYSETFLPKIKVFKMKHKEGQVERVNDDYSVIGRSLFKKETNIQLFVGLKVKLSTGEDGVIEGSFGQSGKFKVRIPNGLKPETKQVLGGSSKKKTKGSKGDTESAKEEESRADVPPVQIILAFKRYVFDSQKKMIQT